MILSNESNIKRLAIFFFYDKDGIVDDYITYMLSDLNNNLNELLFVSNGKLINESREKVRLLTDNILERENKGFDVWAYKEGLEYYGWDKLTEFDEIILMNFTMFGPLYAFENMFTEMNNRNLDFWGITKHHGFSFDPFGTIPYGYIPEHIQSSFIAIRNTMFCSEEFQSYWNNMPNVNSYGEAVGKHEAIFTKKFVDMGFISDVYVNTDDLKDDTHYPLMIMPLELVKNRKCPVIKRKSFTNEYYEFINCTLGEPTVQVYEYIENNLDYDVNLIWDNLLRVENMADIKNRMHLNYILPKYNNNEKADALNHDVKKIALILHIYFVDLANYCLEYVKSMPRYADIYITTDTEEKKKAIESIFKELDCNSLNFIVIENRGRDVSALLVGCKKIIMNYDLVCFAHDKKTEQFKPYTIGKSFAYKCFENILGSKAYVNNVIDTFDKNGRLGMIVPPPPNHASFYGIFGTEWGDNYYNTVGLASKMNLRLNINLYKEPIAPLGTMFWVRPKALKKLFDIDWSYEDFPKEPNKYDGTILHAVERLYPFVVQDAGYYTAWTMNDKFAAIELTNLHFMLREISMTVYGTIGHQMGFNVANYNLYNQLSLRKVIKFKLKKYIPVPIWNITKRIYCLFGGEKWLG